MSKEIDINQNQPHTLSEVICVKCGFRWWAVRSSDTLLKRLECPSCTIPGYVIETGERIKEKDLL